ncbi:MAG: nitrilase-related carbon-nitrogen hydrolase [Planctomycetota bacterium]|jgi:predicted amidohydrolase
MKVLGIQYDIAWEDPEENFRRCEPLIAQAAAEGARLVVLPEMFDTGFSMRTDRNTGFAETTCAFLAAAAKQWDLWIAGGFSDPYQPRPRNACALFDPQGREVMRYHKIHPFSLAGEQEHFSAGEKIPTVRVDDVRVTALICYDLRFPEPFRLAAKQTDLFLVVANWPSPRASAWRTLLAARAIENQCYVLGVNRVGEGDGKHYLGDSALVDPMGAVLSSASEQTAMVGGEVDPDRVKEKRKQFSFLADRKPELYRSIEDAGSEA